MHGLERCCALLMWMHMLSPVQSSPDCTLERFKESHLFDDNFELYGLEETYKSGVSVRVPCKVGHRGFFKLICSSGQWIHHGDKCKLISCGHPGDALFADFKLVDGRDYEFGSRVEYNCLEGYQMTSFTKTRNCLQGGWDGHLPECEPIMCPPPPNLDMNKVSVDGDLDQPTFGSVLQFHCRSRGDMLVGASQIHCEKNGVWSGIAPTCQEISCEKPQDAKFKVEGAKAVYKENEVLRYSCNLGYKKVDARSSVCRKIGVTSQWTPMPECKIITCKLSPPPRGTQYDPVNQTIFRPGESVTVSCEEKEWVKSTEFQSAELSCQNTGNWDFRPVCQKVTCSNRAEHVIWQWPSNTIEMSQRKKYWCSDGYEATSSQSTATCTRQDWEPKPLCKEISCEKPQDANFIVDGDKVVYKENEVLRYSCNPGYEKVDDQLSVCRKLGWTPMPECKQPSKCGSTIVLNGFSQLHKNKLYYTCNDGFKLLSKGWWAEASCVNSKWNTQECVASSDCGRVPAIPNLIASLNMSTRFSEGFTVPFNCTDGHQNQHLGLKELSCKNGKWDSNGVNFKQICTSIENKCTSPPKVKNAVILAPFQKDYLSNTTLIYKCSRNYTMEREGTIKCRNGTWTRSFITC